ncbi:F0F1 ATP synthase subunit B [Ahrensia sp. R2A130]|uniref:F0F1 ATP synthase subunit B n=1 Tax=Ahrensia sp. R2A130 TaxID=744979 RepID=UPI0001E0F053|nr:F0F1 ATP synthase subunit B [Ahrensia sp. R2A130]EFL90969.1 ATP synthase B' chain [Ahrensia sp. R2A130]
MATPTTEPGAAAGVFPPFDTSTFTSQILWLVLSFGLFYYIMSRVVLPRISGILETRSGRIAQDLDEANRLKDESDAAIAAYEQDLATAKTNAHKIAQEARDAGKAEADVKRAEVEADMTARVADAEARIAKIKSDAMSDVGSIATETAETLVSQLLGSKVTKAEVAKAVSNVKG